MVRIGSKNGTQPRTTSVVSTKPLAKAKPLQKTNDSKLSTANEEDDEFDLRTTGAAPLLSTEAPETRTPKALKAAMLAEGLQMAPGAVARRKAAPPRDGGEAVGPHEGTRRPAPMGMVGAIGGLMGQPDPAELRAQMQQSGGWSQLGHDTRQALLQRMQAPGTPGAVATGQLAMTVNGPAWGAANADQQAEALRRVARLPVPDGSGRVPEEGPARSAADVRSDLEASPAFGELNPDKREALLRRVEAPGRRGEVTRQLVDKTMQRSPQWALLDTDGQTRKLSTVAQGADFEARNPDLDALPEKVSASRGFAVLDPKTQTGLRERMGARSEFALNRSLQRIVESPEFGRASASAQADALKAALAQNPRPPSALGMMGGMGAKAPLVAPGGMGGGLFGGGLPGTKQAPPAAPPAEALQRRLEASGALAHLGADERKALQESLHTEDGVGNALRLTLEKTLDDPNFGLRTAQERAQNLRAYLDHTASWELHGDAPPGAGMVAPAPETLPRDAVAEVRGLPGYAQLAPTERKRLEAVLRGERNPMSRAARRNLDAFTFGLELEDPQTQAGSLRTFLKEGAHVPGNMDSIDLTQDVQHATNVGRGQLVQDFRFRGATEDAMVHTVRVGDHRVQVYVPAQAPELEEEAPHLATIQDVTAGLARLPPESLATVQRVVINPVRNPDDGYWERTMEIPGFRANATAGRGGDMTVYPWRREIDREALGDVMRHEAGHFNSYETLYEAEDSLWPTFKPDWGDWRAAARQDVTMVSRYGSENDDEDYAEAYGLYMGTRGTPIHDEYRAVFPNRFALLDKLVD